MLASELDIHTLKDLLYYFPYKYIDRSVIFKINQLSEGMPYVQLRGQIIDIEEKGEGGRHRLEALFTDGTGYIRLVWFAGIKFTRKSLKFNTTYLLLGKPTVFNGGFNISHPELEIVTPSKQLDNITKLHPIYHTTDRMKRSGFNSKVINQLITDIFNRMTDIKIPETLPDYLIKEYNLVSLDEAIRTIHNPKSMEDLPRVEYRHKFEELFFLQLNILHYTNQRNNKYKGLLFSKVGKKFNDFYKNILPFELTDAQKRVIKEIHNDLRSGNQMNRLLQGDVGSGKTIVALLTILLAIDNGFQAAIIAPTEILAEQHFVAFSRMLKSTDIKIALLTGLVKGKKRQKLFEDLKSGEINILVGTHAVLEDNVMFNNLGLSVIDEQHRFGVKQRSKMWQKNVNPPHILVMTATPIPRTLAMTVYGDLDVSIIDELPKGRKPIQTFHIYEEASNKIVELVNREVAIGHQVYFVYPLIKESEKIDLRDLEQGFENICKSFPNFNVGKLHGKMKDDEKNIIMQKFQNKELHILVSTTVIEVGVDVPNASVMVIVNANRFGLAQLHQLRGRVGRGAEQSYCVLVTPYQLAEATHKRMEIMTDTTNGFVIAEEDLKLRGPGDLEGTQQSGMLFNLKIAHLVRDHDILETARQAAQKVINIDPNGTISQNASMWKRLSELRKTNIDWSSIS